ncbi:hypothetical protein [Ornithinimicrobium faecis]|uniref:hypothetical protein n=1 Tax=Ornithinimicrobium faecis TaxID=2934158 RepID=UPI0021198DE6|nr:hypothetical protein [Ornithinimicrobium sp. HY1745]
MGNLGGTLGGDLGGVPPGTPGADAPVSSARRWAADPLPLLGLLALTGIVLGVLHLIATPIPWPVPALLAVVAAGLALSGST